MSVTASGVRDPPPLRPTAGKATAAAARQLGQIRRAHLSLSVGLLGARAALAAAVAYREAPSVELFVCVEEERERAERHRARRDREAPRPVERLGEGGDRGEVEREDGRGRRRLGGGRVEGEVVVFGEHAPEQLVGAEAVDPPHVLREPPGGTEPRRPPSATAPSVPPK